MRAWGLRAHELVAERAMELLPDEPFFDAFGDLIVEYSTYPDTKWRGEDPNEQYRHYYDVDLSPNGKDPQLGMLPWALADNYRMFVEALKAEDWERAALLAGAIAHYATDVTMPLHTTSDYNPGGRHVAFEDGVDAMLDEVTIYEYYPELLENVFQAVVAVAHESFSFTGYENGKLNYWLAQGVLWNDVLRAMVENRLNVAVRLTSDIWYTALVEAGLLKPGVQAEDGSKVAWIILAAAIIIALAATAYVLKSRARRMVKGEGLEG
ncbi:MAG: zinc dependent phospholipase C family protein [Hadesarchaea archaeon]|nr:zinc dependent phospholipase C family protein [Hadesarchaea archaeon]